MRTRETDGQATRHPAERGFVEHLRGQVSKPLVIVLDNATILEFLSAYSPELNRIETMWRLMKHRWMEVKRRTQEELERAVEHIFEHFGSQFKMEF